MDEEIVPKHLQRFLLCKTPLFTGWISAAKTCPVVQAERIASEASIFSLK
jgi:hypothetical protein